MNGDELAKQSLVRVGNQLGKAIAMTSAYLTLKKWSLLGVDITKAQEIVFPAIKRNVENPVANDFPAMTCLL